LIGCPANAKELLSCVMYQATTGESPKYAWTRPVLSAVAASVSFGNVWIEICALCWAESLWFSFSRNAAFVVPSSTETVLPDRLTRPLMWSGLPFLTISDCPTRR
jgi:hypothetical protein